MNDIAFFWVYLITMAGVAIAIFLLNASQAHFQEELYDLKKSLHKFDVELRTIKGAKRIEASAEKKLGRPRKVNS